MADFVIEGGFDDRGILEGFKRLVDEGTKAGRKIGAGFDDELNRFGKRSIASLQQELSRLQSRQLRVNVDSTAFTKTSEKIKEVQKLIDQANNKKLTLQFDPGSINGLTARLQRLQARTLELNVDTKEFQDAQLQVDALQQKIQRISRVPVAAGSLEALNRELQDLQARQVRLKVDSRAFSVVGAQIQQVQGQIDNVNNRRLLINADPRSLVAMQVRLQDLNQQLQRVAVGSSAFKNLQREAKGVEQAIARASGASRQLGGIGSSITSQIAAFASIAGAITLFRGVIDQAVRLETITRKLSNTLGPQGAAGALAFTKELSDRLGLSYTTLANTFGSFTAAATSANVPMQVQRDLFAAVAKSAQAFGLSNEELGGTLTALRQIASKGVVSMEELRQQLGERLPIAFGAAANGLGVTQQELIKLVESGRLTAAEFFPALTKGLNELTAGAVGATTAAQNFQILSNAWEELQASFGTSLLPEVIKQVKNLTGVLNGIGVAQEASLIGLGTRFGLLGNLLGDVSVQGAQAVGALKALQSQFGLTDQESRNLFAAAAKEVGVVKDRFGQLRLTTEQYQKVLERLPDLARQFRNANPDALAKLRAEAAAGQELAKQIERAAAAEKARAEVIAQINELRRQEPVRRLDDQITVGRSLLNFAQASVGLEQERFNTARARNQYEIDNAKALGLTQDQIAARERANDELKRQSLIKQYKSLLQTQAIESVMLQLSQRRAQVEAQIAVNKAQQAAVEAQIALAKAKTPEDAAKAAEAARLAQINVGLAQQQLRILQATAPLEAAAAQAAAETARQQLRTQGASLGIEQTLLKIAPAQTINNEAFNKGVALLNKLNGEAGKLLTPIESTGQTIVKAFKDANGVINIVSRTADKAGTSVKELGENVGLAEDFTDDIKKANLADSIGAASLRASAFAEQMYLAANSARSLKDDLTRAAGLSPSRFTGGPVDAGTRYRINDGPGGRSLGQESFLSRAGDLSLINRPFSSLWTAPSAGIVLPAVLTDQLKQRGAFDTGRRGGKRIAAAVAAGARPGGQSTTDRLEVAVTNLAAQVQALNRKSWTVQQRVTNSPGTTQVRLLSSML